MVRFLASGHSCPWFYSQHSPKNFIDVAEFNQWRRLDKCVQWLENLDQSHLVLASGKPVLQKHHVTKCVQVNNKKCFLPF